MRYLEVVFIVITWVSLRTQVKFKYDFVNIQKLPSRLKCKGPSLVTLLTSFRIIGYGWDSLYNYFHWLIDLYPRLKCWWFLSVSSRDNGELFDFIDIVEEKNPETLFIWLSNNFLGIVRLSIDCLTTSCFFFIYIHPKFIY